MKHRWFVSLTLFCCVLLSCSKSTQISRTDTPESVAPEAMRSTTPQVSDEEIPDTGEKLTIAVLDFENVAEDASLNPLRDKLHFQFTALLKKSPVLRIVGRKQLDKIMKELKLNESSVIAAETVQKIGQSLGAQTLFFGGFFQLKQKRLYLNGHFYRTETAEVITSLGGHCRFEDSEGLEKVIEKIATGITTHVEKQKGVLFADLWYERGRNAEKDGRPDEAKVMYEKALEFYGDHRGSREKLGLEPPEEQVEKIAVAVLPFHIGSGDADFKVLAVGISDLFTTELVNNPNLRVVERHRLYKNILPELAFNESVRKFAVKKGRVIDEETALRVGKIIGVPMLYFGGLTDVFGTTRLDGQLWRVVYGDLVGAEGKSCDSDDLPEKLPQLVEAIARGISDGIERQRPQLLADIYYQKGLYFEEAKKPDEALEMYWRAKELDEDHKKAHAALERLESRDE